MANYHYQIVTFTKGYDGQAYQEVDVNSNVVRFTDMDGNTIPIGVVEYSISDPNPPQPSWGT